MALKGIGPCEDSRMSRSAASLMPIRSELSVPGDDARKIQRALTGDADAIFLDLEDAVAPDRKVAARNVVIEALTQFDWGRLPRAVRVNGVNSPWFFRDLIEIGTAVHDLAKFVIPKVGSVADVMFIDRLLSQIEREIGRTGPIALELQIEDAKGLSAIREIAGASSRVRELTFGQGDFAAATGMPAAEIGVADEWDQAVSGDRWLVPRQSVVFGARSAGARALNGPYAAYRDDAGFRAYCRMSRGLGFDGVWCIHPGQIAPGRRGMERLARRQS